MATRAEHPEPRPPAAGPCRPPAVRAAPAITKELPPAASPVDQALLTPPSRPMDLRWSLEDPASPTEAPEDPDRCTPQALLQVGEDVLHTPEDQDTDLLADLLDQGDPLAPGLLQTGLLTVQEATPPPGGRAQA